MPLFQVHYILTFMDAVIASQFLCIPDFGPRSLNQSLNQSLFSFLLYSYCNNFKTLTKLQLPRGLSDPKLSNREREQLIHS